MCGWGGGGLSLYSDRVTRRFLKFVTQAALDVCKIDKKLSKNNYMGQFLNLEINRRHWGPPIDKGPRRAVNKIKSFMKHSHIMCSRLVLLGPS